MADKSSRLFEALTLVRGVLVLLPFSEPVGVEVVVEAVPATEAFFAAFSASRFCFEAEGGIVVKRQESSASYRSLAAPQIFD